MSDPERRICTLFPSCNGVTPIHLNLAWIGQKLGPALSHSQWLIWPLLVGCIVLGIVAVISPNRFRTIASSGARWVDTDKLLQKLDTPFNVDNVVLRHSRVFGVAVLISSLFLAYLFWLRFSGGQVDI